VEEPASKEMPEASLGPCGRRRNRRGGREREVGEKKRKQARYGKRTEKRPFPCPAEAVSQPSPEREKTPLEKEGETRKRELLVELLREVKQREHANRHRRKRSTRRPVPLSKIETGTWKGTGGERAGKLSSIWVQGATN